MQRVPGFLRRSVYRVHFFLAAPVGVVAFLVLSLTGIVFALVFRRQARRAPVLFARSFAAVMKTVLVWRIRLDGGERLHAGPTILLANHQSNLDIVTYGSVFPPGTAAVGKRELLRLPLFGWFFAATGNILLDRSDRTKAIETIDQAARRIRDERISVWMFPEGHRNQKETLLPFKKGAFHLAIAAQVPVTVVVSEPVWTLLDAHRGLVRPGTFRIRVLAPIPTAGRTPDDVDALLEEVHAAMQAGCDYLAATARPRIG